MGEGDLPPGGGGIDGAGGPSAASPGTKNPAEDPLVKKWLEEKSQETKEKVEENKAKERKRKMMLGGCYLLAMGVCGIVLVALGSTLTSLAENCGTTATYLGSVFVTRGCGAILGAFSSAKLYATLEGNRVITTTLIALSAVLVYMPFVTEVWELHVCFGLLGLSTAITDTGCQIMTRFLWKQNAGPWLGANTVSFGIAGALVPAIAYATDSLYIQYCVLAMIALTGAIVLFFAGTVEFVRPVRVNPGKETAAVGWSKYNPCACNPGEYKTEIIVAWMVFWLIGGKVTATAFYESYVDDTGIISSDNEDLLIMVLWGGVTIGRILGVIDQTFINTPVLYSHLTIFLVGGVLAMSLVLALPDSSTALWIAVASYGFFNGPTVGYCYDLVNRLTIPSEKGMSMVMFGLNFGASLVPYVMSQIWDAGGGPDTLTVTIFLSMLIPLPLLYLTKVFRNDKSAYEAVATAEEETDDDIENEGSEGGPVAAVV